MPTLPAFVYPGLAGASKPTYAPRPNGTLIVNGVPKPTPLPTAPKPPTVGAPVPAPAAPSSPTAPSPKPYDPNAYNLDTDPVVAQIKAANAQGLGQQDAAALEGKRNLLLGFGSQEIARQLLGMNDPTIGAISDNPDTSQSTLGRINRSFREQGHQTDESLNKANLFYSGTRVKALSDLGYAQQSSIADATSALREKLAQIDQAVTDAQSAARDREIQARNDALNRAVQFASQYGVDPGAGPAPQAAALQSAGLDFTGIPTAGQIQAGAEPLWKQIQRQLGIAA